MRVLVTGATGFVGKEIVRQLRDAGHAARILARNPSCAAARGLAEHCGAEIRPGNVLDARSLTPALADCHAVIHLVGIISEIGGQTFERIHIKATENVIAAARQAGVRRCVHMSALGTRPDAVSRYHQTKWAAEEIVRSSGLDWTIFRPSLIYGSEDQFVNLFAKMARFSPILPVMGTGRARFQPVAVEDVAACFVKALTESRSVGQAFDLCGPETLTLPEILRAILAATNRRRLIVHVPMPIARIQAAFLEWAYPTLLHRAPPLNRDQLIMLQEDNVGNAEAAMQLSQLHPPSFADGIRRYLQPAR